MGQITGWIPHATCLNIKQNLGKALLSPRAWLLLLLIAHLFIGVGAGTTNPTKFSDCSSGHLVSCKNIKLCMEDVCTKRWRFSINYGICKEISTDEFCRNWRCQTNYTKCDNEIECKSKEWVCDGKEHCTDGSDEESCRVHSCEPGWKKCANRVQCIRETHFCDGSPHCLDKSDEKDCDLARRSNGENLQPSTMLVLVILTSLLLSA